MLCTKICSIIVNVNLNLFVGCHWNGIKNWCKGGMIEKQDEDKCK